jgi:hypothetical protein
MMKNITKLPSFFDGRNTKQLLMMTYENLQELWGEGKNICYFKPY